MKVLLSGPYGGFNLGDDAIASELARHLGQKGHKVSLATSDPSESSKVFPNLTEHYLRLNLRRLSRSMLDSIRRHDAVVIGGGEQLAEPRLPNPIWGHLATTYHQARLAKRYRRKFCLVAVGAPTRFSRIGEWMMRKTLETADFVSVRDSRSMSLLHELAPQARITLGADPVLSYPQHDREESRAWLERIIPETKNKKVVLIVPANDKVVSLHYLQQINTYIGSSNVGSFFMYFCTDRQPNYDLAIERENLLRVQSNAKWFPSTAVDVATFAKLCAACDLAISSRMHALIFSRTQGTPCISLSRSAKMSSFAEESCSESLDIMRLDSRQLLAATKRAMSTADFVETNREFLRTSASRLARLFDALEKVLSPSNSQV